MQIELHELWAHFNHAEENVTEIEQLVEEFNKACTENEAKISKLEAAIGEKETHIKQLIAKLDNLKTASASLVTYLTDRKQFVSQNTFKSHSLFLIQGVPQDSILGLMSFLVFINNMPLSCKTGNMDICAGVTLPSMIDELKSCPRNQSKHK